jgi:Outer membrane protein beta-barrel domain
MKFSIIAFFLVVFSISQINSQIYLGFTVGGNGANVTFDDDDMQHGFKSIDKLRYGYNVGISGDYYFAKVLSVELDFSYTLKGFAFEQTYSSGFKQFNYGQVNAAGKIDLNPDSDIIISPYLSPYAAYWISGKRMQTDIKTGIPRIDKIDLKSDTTYAYNRYDLGIIIGVDFKFEQPNHRYFILGTKYEQGMISTDIDKVDGWRNKNFSIYFRYMFRVKK